jgi:undecaprenyl-diphosphatase
VFLALGLLIGLSRIALGLHYPSDVIAGVAVGWCAALFVTRPCRRWLDGLVSRLGGISDRLLDPIWNRLDRVNPSRR